MEYYLSSYVPKGLILDDVKKEIRMSTDINVGIVGDEKGFIQSISSIEFIVKNFDSYDQLSALTKDAVNNWVAANYPST